MCTSPAAFAGVPDDLSLLHSYLVLLRKKIAFVSLGLHLRLRHDSGEERGKIGEMPIYGITTVVQPEVNRLAVSLPRGEKAVDVARLAGKYRISCFSLGGDVDPGMKAEASVIRKKRRQSSGVFDRPDIAAVVCPYKGRRDPEKSETQGYRFQQNTKASFHGTGMVRDRLAFVKLFVEITPGAVRSALEVVRCRSRGG